MIRDAKPGTQVDIHAFYGGAHGVVGGKIKKSGHIWYNVQIIDSGTSRFEFGDWLECRCHWLTRSSND